MSQYCFIWNIPIRDGAQARISIYTITTDQERAIANIVAASKNPDPSYQAFRKDLQPIHWRDDLESLLRRFKPQITTYPGNRLIQ